MSDCKKNGLLGSVGTMAIDAQHCDRQATKKYARTQARSNYGVLRRLRVNAAQSEALRNCCSVADICFSIGQAMHAESLALFGPLTDRDYSSFVHTEHDGDSHDLR